MTTNRRCER